MVGMLLESKRGLAKSAQKVRNLVSKAHVEDSSAEIAREYKMEESVQNTIRGYNIVERATLLYRPKRND